MDELQALHDKLKPCDKLRKYAFVSYNWEDRGTVWRDIAELQARGYNLWFDNRNTAPTHDSWRKDCIPAIEDQYCVLVLFYASRHSLMSRNCFREMEARTDDRTHETHFGNDVPLMVLEVSRIENITVFLQSLHDELDGITPTDEKQKGAIGEKKKALYLFKEYFFKNNNERIRIRPKDDPDRIGDYYAEICAELDRHMVWRSSPPPVNTPAPKKTPAMVKAPGPAKTPTPDIPFAPAVTEAAPEGDAPIVKKNSEAKTAPVEPVKITPAATSKRSDSHDLPHKTPTPAPSAPSDREKSEYELCRDAEQFWNSGFYDKAVSDYKELAKAGSVKAAYTLGNIYATGDISPSLWDRKRPVKRDFGAAEAFYRQAARKGDRDSEQRIKIVRSAKRRVGTGRTYSASGGKVFLIVLLQLLPAVIAAPLSALIPSLAPLMLLAPFCIARAITDLLLVDDRNMRILCKCRRSGRGMLCIAQNIAAPIGALAAFFAALSVLRNTHYFYSSELIGRTLLICAPFLLLCAADVFRVNSEIFIHYPKSHLMIWIFTCLRSFIMPILFYWLVGSMHSFWLSLILAIPSVLLTPVFVDFFRTNEFNTFSVVTELLAYGLVFRVYMLTLLGTHETVIKNLLAALGFQLPGIILAGIILFITGCISYV